MSSSLSGDQALDLFAQTWRDITATRYVSAAGFVILLYDHLLTLDREIEDIWKAPWTLPKYLFLAIRYVVPLTMTVETFQLSGISLVDLSRFCPIWLPVSTSIGIISIGFSNLLIIFRLWAIWGRNQRFMYWTFAGLLLTQVGAVAALVSQILATEPSILYNTSVHICILTKKAHTFLLWIPGVCFEVMVFVATFWNAFDRPRSQDVTLLSDLHRDGLFYFVLLFGLRLSNLIITIVAPISLIFVGVFFIWCATTLTVTRFILDLRRLASERNSRTVSDELPMVTTEDWTSEWEKM